MVGHNTGESKFSMWFSNLEVYVHVWVQNNTQKQFNCAQINAHGFRWTVTPPTLSTCLLKKAVLWAGRRATSNAIRLQEQAASRTEQKRTVQSAVHYLLLYRQRNCHSCCCQHKPVRWSLSKRLYCACVSMGVKHVLAGCGWVWPPLNHLFQPLCMVLLYKMARKLLYSQNTLHGDCLWMPTTQSDPDRSLQ